MADAAMEHSASGHGPHAGSAPDEAVRGGHHWFNRNTNRLTRSKSVASESSLSVRRTTAGSEAVGHSQRSKSNRASRASSFIQTAIDVVHLRMPEELFGRGSTSLVTRLEQLIESDPTLAASLQRQVQNRRGIARERLHVYTAEGAEMSARGDASSTSAGRGGHKRLSSVGLWLRMSTRSSQRRRSSDRCDVAAESLYKQPSATQLFGPSPTLSNAKFAAKRVDFGAAI